MPFDRSKAYDMRVRASFNPSNLKRKIKARARGLQANLPEQLRRAGRLIAVSLATSAQPYGIDDEARKKGEGAVIRDLTGGRSDSGSFKTRGAFVVISDSTAAKATAGKNGAVRLFAAKGRVYGADRQFFKPYATMKEMEAHHKSQRDARGRVTQAGARTRDVGRWRFIEQMIVAQSTFQKYLAQEIARVGFGKGGWAACAGALGGTRGLARWITKHKSPALVIENYNATNSTITLVNNVDYASQILDKTEKRQAVRIGLERLLKAIVREERQRARLSPL
jgi:hypothetical protein